MEKKIIIPDNHLMLGNSSEIKSLCDPLSTIGISSFDYERCYDNGKITSLGTDPEYLKNYYSQGVYVTVSELEEIHELHGRQNNYVFDFYSSSMAATDHLGSIENRKKHRLNLSLGETFNITNRIYFLIRQKGFYEIFGFGCNNKKDFVSLCMRKLHIFKRFIKYFKSNAQKMIADTPYLEGPSLLINKQNVKENKASKLLKLFHSKKNNLLTPREKECLFYLLLGETTKQIGPSLSISARTVESYINQIKLKTNLYTREQLVDFFLSNYFFEDDIQDKFLQRVESKSCTPNPHIF